MDIRRSGPMTVVPGVPQCEAEDLIDTTAAAAQLLDALSPQDSRDCASQAWQDALKSFQSRTYRKYQARVMREGDELRNPEELNELIRNIGNKTGFEMATSKWARIMV